jgi:hypothetical protein
MGAHCRTVVGAMHHRAISATQFQQLAQLAAMTMGFGILSAAFGALIGQRMTP